MKKYLFSSLIVGLFALGFAASDEPDKTDTPDQGPQTDIPADSQATPNPDLGGAPTTSMPNIQYTVVAEGNDLVFRIDMTGIQDPKTLEWIKLIGTSEIGQNFWIEIDGDPKGVRIYNSIEDNSHTVPVDLVFLVDNSSSMSQEADAVARDIIDWSNKLAERGLDIKFACVGYDGAINGAIDFTTNDLLSEWLNKSTGRYRTRGFGGDNADYLKADTQYYRTGGGDANECGMAALRYADEKFTFRTGANRIYVNFTDEPNQINGKSQFSVETLKDNWETSQGTIHTVFSEDKYYDRNECNRLMSEYTGGTYIYTDSRFTGVTLDSLPVTDAMQNSYIIRITNILKYIDGQPHELHITIKSPDGSVKVERWFTVLITRD